MMRILIIGMSLVFAMNGVTENWTGFRGPTGQGISQEKGLPIKWSETENVLWKFEDPGKGWSSPIVYEGSVFLTTSTEEGQSCRLICLDAETGSVKWDKEIVRQELKRIERNNSYATPTPVTDGKHVYVVYNDGSIEAVDFEGNIVWKNRDYPYYSQHGMGVSPTLYKDVIIIPYDYSAETGDRKVGWQIPWDKSYILALDKNNGKEVWKAKRGLSRIAHVTPNILRNENGQDRLISGAGDVIQSFDLTDGSLIWTVDTKGEGLVPSIVIGDELVYGNTGFMDHFIVAIRPGGKGNVTDSHVVWKDQKSSPSVPSMLYVKPHLYTVTDGGIAVCRNAGTGEIIWRERIGGNHYASPVWIDGKIYFLSMEGETVIINDGTTFEIAARNTIGEKCQASISVSGQKLFIRSEEHLFCIAESHN